MSQKYTISNYPFQEKVTSHELLPIPLRCLIVGTVGCGKTTLMYNMITKKWGIPFKNLYIFSTCLYQQLYKKFEKSYKEVLDPGTFVKFFYNINSFYEAMYCSPETLVVFDDCELVKRQRVMEDYYASGHGKNISCIYICTSYARVKQIIRENLNFICVFKQNKYNVKIIYNNYASSDFTFDRFNEICNECWNDDYGFLTINIVKQLKDGRYMKKFDKPILK